MTVDDRVASRFCESCGDAITPTAAYCENCGQRVAVGASRSSSQRAVEPPRRRPGPRRAVKAATFVALIAAVAAVVLLVTGVLGGGGQTDEPARAHAAAAPTTPVARALDPLPRRDQADGYIDLETLDGAITLAADHDHSGDPGVSDWVVYAIPGRDARQACREVARQWVRGLIGLSDDFTNDPERARSFADTYRTTPGGCSHSFLENSPSSPNLGPTRWDIAVRAFTYGDPLTHDPQAVRALGAITPQPAPIYEGPYSEVSIVRVVLDTSERFANGQLAADLRPEAEKQPPASEDAVTTVACDANIRVADGSCAFANNVFWTYWSRGQASSINVYDPASGRFGATRCELSDREVTCVTGGTAVSFPQSAVDLYDQRQADRYAATHDVR
jgi:hypothetical protein